jgi:hypothetical protein
VRLLLAAAVAIALCGPAAAAFVAHEQDFQCLRRSAKVEGEHFFVFHRDPKRLQKAMEVARAGRSATRYPVGTILQLFPFEAMVKRGGHFNPRGHGWEFFSLKTSAQGTEILQRGGRKVSNRLGSCQGCHAAAKRFDYVCEGHGVTSLGLPENLIELLQTDPRCPPGS